MTDDETARSIGDALRRALSTKDLASLRPLLAEDVRWGDDGHPRSCRGREAVLSLMTARLAEGAEATIAEITPGPAGVLCELDVSWPPGSGRPARRTFHVYELRHGRIVEIHAFEDRASAATTAGLGA